jgi:sugar-specific transcriptional regulator TrmB
MNQKLLEEIGLTRSERIVYTTLLKSGSIKVGELLKRVDLHRSRIYEAINRLVEKGLVSSVKRENINYYSACDPERLVSYIEEQKKALARKERKVKELLPELRKQMPTELPEGEAHVFAGKEGFKSIRKDVLRQGKDLLLIGAIGKEDELEYFFPGFDRQRVKQGIKLKVLYDHQVRGRKISKLKLMERKFLPKEYSSPAVINIYADRVVNVLWKDDNPLCFMIINQEIADSYRKWFRHMWKHSK